MHYAIFRDINCLHILPVMFKWWHGGRPLVSQQLNGTILAAHVAISASSLEIYHRTIIQ